MSDALAKARAIADAATPRPWHPDLWLDEWSVVRWGESASEFATDICDPRTMTEADAAHVATFDPPTVSAMLDVIEAADVACKQGRPVDAFQALNDVDDALHAFRDLLEGNV